MLASFAEFACIRQFKRRRVGRLKASKKKGELANGRFCAQILAYQINECDRLFFGVLFEKFKGANLGASNEEQKSRFQSYRAFFRRRHKSSRKSRRYSIKIDLLACSLRLQHLQLNGENIFIISLGKTNINKRQNRRAICDCNQMFT